MRIPLIFQKTHFSWPRAMSAGIRLSGWARRLWPAIPHRGFNSMVMDWIGDEEGIDGATIRAESLKVAGHIEKQAEKILFNLKRLLSAPEHVR
jgi:hypothetical protein